MDLELLRAVSFDNSAIITKLTTLSIRKKRSENSLDVIEPQFSAHQQNALTTLDQDSKSELSDLLDDLLFCKNWVVK